MTRYCRHSRKHSGFTLLEVLVAFSILSVSLAVIMLGISKSIRVSEVTRDYSRAITLAESTLAEFSEIDLTTVNQTTGRFDNRYDWSVGINPYVTPGEEIQAANYAPYELIVKVVWPGRDKQREIVLSTIRLGPPKI